MGVREQMRATDTGSLWAGRASSKRFAGDMT